MKVRTIRTLAEFEGVAAEYRALTSRSPDLGPYLSYRWVSSAWSAAGDGPDRKVFWAEDDAGVVAAVPVSVRRERYKRVPVRLLGLLAERWSGTGLPQRDATSFWPGYFPGWMLREFGGGVVLRIGYFASPQDPLARAFNGATFRTADNPYIRLGCTWDEFLAQRSRNFRRTIKRKTAALEEHGEPVTVQHLRNPDADTLDAVVSEVSERSWQGVEHVAVAAGSAGRRFYRHLASSEGDFDIDLMVFSVGGRSSGYLVALRQGAKCYAYDTGFDPAVSELSPGLVLHFRLLESLCADGFAELDLGPPAPYKERFDASVRQLTEVQLLPSTWLRMYDRLTDLLRRSPPSEEPD